MYITVIFLRLEDKGICKSISKDRGICIALKVPSNQKPPLNNHDIAITRGKIVAVTNLKVAWELKEKLLFTYITADVVFFDQWDDAIYVNVCVSFLISTGNKK